MFNKIKVRTSIMNKKNYLKIFILLLIVTQILIQTSCTKKIACRVKDSYFSRNLKSEMKLIQVLLIVFTFSSKLFPQQPVIIPKLSGAVKLDGVINDAVWEDAHRFEMIMQTPVFGKQPSEKTDIRMFFNDKFLFASAKFYYADINNLSRPGKQRDYLSGNCDWFGVCLDTFNDDENMICF